MTAARKTKSKGSLASARTAGAAKTEATPLAVLRAARSLLRLPDHWTRGANARAKGGRRVASEAPEAVCWCADGALIKVSGGWSTSAYKTAHRCLYKALPVPVLIHVYNDATHRTHPEILSWFDRAIKLAAKEAREVTSRGKAHA